MTQMESPKRKMQKKNDYQRHKLFRKIKRRRKAQAEAEQQVAMKQLRKKLKLPKFGDGKGIKSDTGAPLEVKDGMLYYKETGEPFYSAGLLLPEVEVVGDKSKVNPWAAAGRHNTSSYWDSNGVVHGFDKSVEAAINYLAMIMKQNGYDTSGYYDNVNKIGKAMTVFSPTRWIGTLRGTGMPWEQSNQGLYSGYGETGRAADQLFDIMIGSKIGEKFSDKIQSGKVLPEIKNVAKPIVDNAMKQYDILANNRLYSDNQLVNAYATIARRYGLPDKARLPYLIRRIKSTDLPDIKNGEINIQGPRFRHANFTTDRPVVGHKKGNWDTAQQAWVINPRDVVYQHNWGSIEPSDMFNIDMNSTFPVNTNDATLITGNLDVASNAERAGIKTITTSDLINQENRITNDMTAFSRLKLGAKAGRRHGDKRYWNAVNDAVGMFGRPKLKDYRLLEKVTGLKSGVQSIKDVKDVLNFKNLSLNDAIKLADARFPNGREMNLSSAYNQIYGYDWNNIFYDPATMAEYNYKMNHPEFW